ncbi:unnamed protein product [Prorocentrum cordatum]|uniref:Uncharacterized protein n=1 Tax=Prorocentrum cordatum TaxID=2364126 RepID=A0ABN9SXI6_9DINO|nr:unnamed protein product [Polarella glacialis]
MQTKCACVGAGIGCPCSASQAARERRRNVRRKGLALGSQDVIARTEGAIKQKLFAVRYAHLVAGYSDPLLHRGRLWSTLAGLKRWQGPETKRKKPVTPAMLEWPRGFLQQEAKLPEEDAVVIWAAVVTAFFFLLRASEYLLQGGSSWSFERVLHGEDVGPRKEGKRVASFQDADEMVIYIKGSKTDQLNVGTVRNHYRAGTTLCPITAMERLQAPDMA